VDHLGYPCINLIFIIINFQSQKNGPILFTVFMYIKFVALLHEYLKFSFEHIFIKDVTVVSLC